MAPARMLRPLVTGVWRAPPDCRHPSLMVPGSHNLGFRWEGEVFGATTGRMEA